MARLSQEATPRKLTIENLAKHRILTSNDGTYEIQKKTPKETETSKSKKYQDISFHSKDLAPVEFVEETIKKFTIMENSVEDKVMKHTVKEPKNVKTPSNTGSALSLITLYDEEINPHCNGDEAANGKTICRNIRFIFLTSGIIHMLFFVF